MNKRIIRLSSEEPACADLSSTPATIDLRGFPSHEGAESALTKKLLAERPILFQKHLAFSGISNFRISVSKAIFVLPEPCPQRSCPCSNQTPLTTLCPGRCRCDKTPSHIERSMETKTVISGEALRRQQNACGISLSKTQPSSFQARHARHPA